jgi:hypothetical protein
VSIYRPKNSPYYQYDFQLKSRRFYGSTGAKSKREAEKVEGIKRAEARQELESASKSAASLWLDDVAARYWRERGQHLAGEGADNCFRDLERLVDYFGKDKLLTEIKDNDVANLVSWRRGQRVARYRRVRGKMVQIPNNL